MKTTVINKQLYTKQISVAQTAPKTPTHINLTYNKHEQ